MARFTGFMCDICNKASTGEVKPEDWIVVKLPGTGPDANKNVCSDKCLLKLARGRNGSATPVATKTTTFAPDKLALYEWLEASGVNGKAKGAAIGTHVRSRHEMGGYVDDCFVCQFYQLTDVKEG